ncbi:death-associated protein kinase dapk-1-like [Mytilus californianus]|uniref:death-associated protein kinase dapk-1-like n=1 Tax=Mytilus californianus TaxID=6549 RepID=UPI002246D179|nr:death-associated protein kinase dapk-1-like [Mytilus californianus]
MSVVLFQVGGLTALMRAAMGGYLEICRLLIDTGCKIDTTDRDGYTALHIAALNGHLQITRCLVEVGASPLVTTHEGQTPYDLAAEYKSLQYKEVMEYLQSVMSEESSGVTGGQGMEGDMVPTEIKLMADKRSIDLYLKLLESGSEKKKDIRLVVVGKNGAGKTSLIKRLFSEENTDVTSTNGIEIHTIKCKAMSDDGIWNKLDGNNEENEIHARLLKQYKGTIEASVEEGTHKAVKETTPSTSFDESETVTQQPKKRKLQVTTESQVEPPVTLQQRNQALEQAKMDIEAMLKYNVDLHDREEYATLLLWDFAGDEEFYHTHQTFLSQDAIYLVVTKLNEADDKKAKEMFQLWMNSIHCYCSTTEVLGSIEEKNKSLYPPVVLVGTHKDKVEASEEVKVYISIHI